ncbi:MAG: 3-dehydroquinate synthase [Bacteroidia bacterium]|nr:MAG: 3-dehydroquinate synthase [Bacteroidia bacterium]
MYALWKPLIDTLRAGTPLLTVEGGEAMKTLPVVRRLWKKLWQYEVERQDVVVFIGGGSMLDVGGFVASTWKRGVPFVYVPTTLIAQVDAAIGGKTGINFKAGKNLIGTFAEPVAIWAYRGFLETLPAREVRSGWVEVLKHAMIVGGALWELVLARDFTQVPSLAILEQAAAVKWEIVAQDPTEKDRRRVLNLGHTLGHVWESLSLSQAIPFTHGEAVAVGLVQEAWLSYQKGYLAPAHLDQLVEKIRSEKLLLPLPSFTWERWLKTLLQDKKRKAGRLYVPIWAAPGEVRIEPVRVQELQAAVRWYKKLLR